MTYREKMINNRVLDHYMEATDYFHEDNIVGIFLQGSQNYELDYEDSDVDTKLIVTPTLRDISRNAQAVSTTHVRENDEHIDFKDIRLMLNTFKKQNLNFLEILFTKYTYVNSLYMDEWDALRERREDIAHYNIHYAIKAMYGIATEKYHAMEHRYPAKIAIMDKYGYDPKQLHHLLRVEEYLKRYVAGESYEDCLVSKQHDYLIDVKRGCHDLETARLLADETMDRIETFTLPYRVKDGKYNISNPEVDELLDNVQYQIIQKSITTELMGRE